ncbi:MAG: TIGR02587 family membrane protein [Cyanobacteriota bacterium]
MTIKRARKHKSEKIWSKEFDDLLRGAAGGFLFGIPLLYTMEVWWIGSFTEPPLMLAAIAATFVVVFLLNRTEGFRKYKDARLGEAVMDSIEAIAIGIVSATCILILLREITLDTSLGEALGKIIFESVPFSLGVALARSFLSGDRYQSPNSDEKPPPEDKTRLNATLADIGGTLIGATIIAFNIAPTDEIPMLVAASSPPWLIAIIVASLLISYGIVFQAGFTNQQQRIQQQGIFQRPLSETVFSYLVSLIAATFMLWFFHQLSFEDPWQMWLSYTLLLGLPATVGGAAGRLLA